MSEKNNKDLYTIRDSNSGASKYVYLTNEQMEAISKLIVEFGLDNLEFEYVDEDKFEEW